MLANGRVRRRKKKVLSRRGRLVCTLLLVVLLFGGLFARQQLPYYIYPVDYFDIITAEAEAVDIDPYKINVSTISQSVCSPP